MLCDLVGDVGPKGSRSRDRVGDTDLGIPKLNIRVKEEPSLIIHT